MKAAAHARIVAHVVMVRQLTDEQQFASAAQYVADLRKRADILRMEAEEATATAEAAAEAFAEVTGT